MMNCNIFKCTQISDDKCCYHCSQKTECSKACFNNPGKCRQVKSGTPEQAKKAESERKFMSGETDICMVSLRAAAGLNLQRANCVVFGELDWSPAIHTQAEDRAHRIGQDDSILCYYLVAEEGTDEIIQEFLGLKVAQFNGIMGDEAESEEDKVIAQAVATEHMKKVVQKIKERA